MIGSKVANIGNRIYDVYTPEEYYVNGNPDGVAIDMGDMILPIISKTSTGYGAKVYKNYIKAIIPENEEQQQQFRKNNDNFVNFSDVQTMKELLDKNADLSKLEYIALSSPDDIFICKRNETDSPLITVLKDSIDAKGADIHAYQHKWPNCNFTNDMRIIDGDDITIKKAATFCKNLDMKLTVTISDASDDIPNPMGKEFTVRIV